MEPRTSIGARSAVLLGLALLFGPAAGLLGWRFAEQWTLLAGYRARGVDRDQGDLGLDTIIQGPVLGVAWRFQL